MSRIRRSRARVLFIAGAAVIGAAALRPSTGSEPDSPAPPPVLPDPWLLPPEGSQVPGRAVPAAQAVGLRDADLVIGVAVAGHHRAYPIRGFWSGSHTVNDLVRGVPITVTYCGLN